MLALAVSAAWRKSSDKIGGSPTRTSPAKCWATCANSLTPSRRKRVLELAAGAVHASRRLLPHHLGRAPLPRFYSAAGLREVPCIEKVADDAETLEIALIENLQRKDLTAFEEADGLQRLADHFAYTHEDISRKIAKARSLLPPRRNAPCALSPRRCASSASRAASISKSLLTRRSLSATAAKRKCQSEAIQRIAQAGLTRDEARRERQEEKNAGPRPQPFIFNFRPENEAFRLRIQFRKSNVSRGELIETLHNLIEMLEHDENSPAEPGAANPAVA